MRFGCCASIEQAESVYQAGFDFIECPVISLIPEESEEAFEKILPLFKESLVPVEVCNIFLPPDLKVVGEAVDEDRIKKYIETALQRVKKIGVDTVVLGSGQSRSVPEGFSHEKAEEQILSILYMIADHADLLDITIVIEPLNTKESNIITSIPEAAKYAKKVKRKSIKVLADFYHMEEENEPLEHIVSYGNLIKHIHVADTERKSPGMGNYPYSEFVDHLKQIDYQGRVSVECIWGDFEKEVLGAREYLESVF